MSDFTPGTGWIQEIDDGRRPELIAESIDMEPVRLFAGEIEFPELDPRPWCREERQVRNDCGGFSNTFTGEGVFVIATGTIRQFSAHFAYREAQRLDGINGDRGSTISGGLKVGQTIGFCPLEKCPYPSSYNSAITQEMRDAAAPFKVAGHAYIETYRDALSWIGTGLGPVNWGVAWNFQAVGNVLEKFIGGGPGHATALVGISPRKDSNGDPYVWLANSGYPVPGFYQVSPIAIQKALDDRYSVAIGYSKLSVPQPRKMAYDPFNAPQTGVPSTENIA